MLLKNTYYILNTYHTYLYISLKYHIGHQMISSKAGLGQTWVWFPHHLGNPAMCSCDDLFPKRPGWKWLGSPPSETKTNFHMLPKMNAAKFCPKKSQQKRALPKKYIALLKMVRRDESHGIESEKKITLKDIQISGKLPEHNMGVNSTCCKYHLFSFSFWGQVFPAKSQRKSNPSEFLVVSFSPEKKTLPSTNQTKKDGQMITSSISFGFSFHQKFMFQVFFKSVRFQLLSHLIIPPWKLRAGT